MATYRDYALAAYAAREQAEADAEAAERDALVTRARSKAAPLWTDATGKPVLSDVTKYTRAELVDEAAGLVVLSVLDDKFAVEVSFAVYPDADTPTQVVTLVDGEWQRGPEVSTMAEVGAVLAGDG